MLSQTARRVLYYVQGQETKRAKFEDLSKGLDVEIRDLRSACEQLKEQGYARDLIERSFSYQSRGVKNTGTVVGIELKEEGRNSRAYFWAKAGGFLFRSVLVPILVAVLAAVITTILTLKFLPGA